MLTQSSLPRTLFRMGLATSLLVTAACDSPTQTFPAQHLGAIATASPTATPLRSASDNFPTTSRDTLRVGSQVVHLRPTTKAEFDRAYATALSAITPDTLDAPALVAAGKRVQRAGIRLVFSAAAGTQTIITDDTTETPAASRYRYWGAANQLHQWVVKAGFWEGSGVVLVDQRTGRRTDTWGQPSASPNGHFFMTASADLEVEYNPNGVQLYQLAVTGPHLVWQRQFNGWEPKRVRWLDNHTVIIYQLEGPTGNEENPRKSFVRLNLTSILPQRPR